MYPADTRPPVRLWPDWSGHETARAIWTDIFEHVVHASGAKGAFIAAYPRIFSFGR